ncbi:peptidase domain-containing ABC transporter [Gluconobacter sp. LMG 1744]|uniref:Peptidase domain-containing ABC transporter n=1 Tax=Gluconobacter cadivus TaxID=2728101 RepID=A0ABR9YSZ2_9PROT|nr:MULTISPECIES: peptidase domain-containing ABC transporter [Gluconobacter]MBF0887284.1 peptidase domain-containing ABC transporter [Gluconobacter cadivus]MBF0890475.1 peptidase domain-containing ABC transporter [Gluconobacter cadivus]MBS1059353.1 peptidase domain-containing ABC transporter [Gluconobacter sp. Dm-44]MBS1074080.1 peptidase domain-containing ABC transporter [Gluconobacter sp. Dm-73]MBS1091439.1 peptidase domain-containing ABC transporter [Gluconobacter sp. Dm-74]
MAAARYHGLELDIRDFAAEPGEDSPSPATLARWLTDQGAVAKGMRLRWRYLVKIRNAPPVVLMFKDGSAGLMVRADAEKGVVWLRDPMGGDGDAPVPVDELRLMQVWTGDVLLVKRRRDESEADAKFDLLWFVKMVLREKKIMRDIAFGSMVLSILQIFPPLIVMQVIDRVVNYHSMATLISLSGFVIILSFYEILLTYARRELSLILSTRLDARISLHAFNRLLALPLEFYEREQTGEILGRFMSVFKVRDFLTGQLMTTLLDLFTLVVILPVLFVISSTLAWMTLAAAGCIGLIVVIFLPPVTRVMGRQVVADMKRGSVLYETVAGIRTVKTLALEATRREIWDERTAEVVRWKLAAGRMASWPQTLAMPFEIFINRGIILIGAYLILTNASSIQAGALMGFMMLGGRVASPLVNLARLMEAFNEVSVSLGEAGLVLNQPTETKALTTGMRPVIKGALSFMNVDFTYPGSTSKALNDVTFDIPAGTMLGLVGRSGSGKSTITRLLQGVSRNYTGYLRLDGVDLREINLTHLRRSFGVVLQDNFLFRGTIRDNITAGRPGLTIDDAIRAARLAGAEEFIERMPAGYDTWIEEGSTNISGGQRQRLAIARAVISDPKLMILDEATSALDPESEALVNANLQRIGKGRTMVIVSHRLSSLVNCHQIAVMDKGKLIDIAPHRVLLERCEIYRMLWLQQNRHMTDNDVPGSAGQLTEGE